MTHYYSQTPNIQLNGSEVEIEVAIRLLDTLRLTDDEKTDRLIIQGAFADNPILEKLGFTYEGDAVYPLSIVEDFKALRAASHLNSMSDRFYDFLVANFDDAHYDKAGYIAHYNDSFSELWEHLSEAMRNIPDWHTDLKKIVDAIYFS